MPSNIPSTLDSVALSNLNELLVLTQLDEVGLHSGHKSLVLSL